MQVKLHEETLLIRSNEIVNNLILNHKCPARAVKCLRRAKTEWLSMYLTTQKYLVMLLIQYLEYAWRVDPVQEKQQHFKHWLKF